MEGRAFLRHALDPHFTAHDFNQMLADGQAETGASETAGGRSIGLAERFEQAGQAIHWNADAGVAH